MQARLLMLFAAFALLGGMTTNAAADEPAEERFGEVHITLKNAEYCKVAVNGDEWTATEFEKNGKLLLVKALRLDEVSHFAIELTPFDPNLAPKTVEVDEKEFKKVRKGRVYYIVAKATAVFEKVKPGEAPKPGETPKPDETPDEDKTGPPPAEPDL